MAQIHHKTIRECDPVQNSPDPLAQFYLVGIFCSRYVEID